MAEHAPAEIAQDEPARLRTDQTLARQGQPGRIQLGTRQGRAAQSGGYGKGCEDVHG